MKTLLLVALVGAAGCTTDSGGFCGDGVIDSGESCDDGNNISGDGCSSSCTVEGSGDTGKITAKWNITNVAGNDLDCPSGFDTAALYSQEIDASYNNVGTAVVDLFNCSDFTGVSDALAPSTYYSWVTIANDNNTSQYATSTSAFIDLTTTDKDYSVDILEDGGYFQLQWQLTQGGSPTTCATQTQVDGVETVSTDIASSSNFKSDIFTCSDHLGITSGLTAGTYTVSVDAINSANQSISTPVNLTNKAIQAPNKITDLGTITIPLD